MNSIASDIAQKRASWAWQKISEQHALPEYRNFVKGVPAMINSNGFIATMVYLQSRTGSNKKMAETVFEHLRLWLVNQKYLKAHDKNAVFEELLGADTHIQRNITAESLAILAWLRRFADVANGGAENVS